MRYAKTLSFLFVCFSLGTGPLGAPLDAPLGCWSRSAVWVTKYVGNRPQLYGKDAEVCLVSRRSDLIRDLALEGRPSVPFPAVRRTPELQWRPDFDERFNRFWTELAERNSHRMLTAGAAQTLQWHFKYALQENRLAILSASQGEG